MKIVCSHAGNKACLGCNHSRIHESDDYSNRCLVSSFCSKLEKSTKCIPFEISEFKFEPLTASPRELTLEEIAVAAMVAWINSQGTIKTIGDLANWSYDIAEAMKAEKAKREKI